MRLPDRMCFREPCSADRDCCRRYNICDRSANVCTDCWYGNPCMSARDCCQKYPLCLRPTVATPLSTSPTGGAAEVVGKCVDIWTATIDTAAIDWFHLDIDRLLYFAFDRQYWCAACDEITIYVGVSPQRVSVGTLQIRRESAVLVCYYLHSSVETVKSPFRTRTADWRRTATALADGRNGEMIKSIKVRYFLVRSGNCDYCRCFRIVLSFRRRIEHQETATGGSFIFLSIHLNNRSLLESLFSQECMSCACKNCFQLRPWVIRWF